MTMPTDLSPATSPQDDTPRRSCSCCATHILRDAAGIVLLSVLLAAGSNLMRSKPLPWIAEKEMEILVPCPEPIGKVEPLAATDSRLREPTTLLVDAREEPDYRAWHAPGAVSFPLDWLAEEAELKRYATQVAKLAARSGKHRVVVYGDGGSPDSGKYLASLLQPLGIKNLFYVTGGAAKLKPGGNVTSVAPEGSQP